MKIELSLQTDSIDSLLKILHEIYEGTKILNPEEKSLIVRNINVRSSAGSYNLKISK